MSVRARMISVVLISAVFTVGLVAMLIITVVTNQQADECLEQAHDISSAVFGLSLLTGDFSAEPTARAAEQWQATYDALGTALGPSTACSHVSFELGESVRPEYERLGMLFDELTQSVERAARSGADWPDAYGVRLTNQMRIAVQSMAGDTERYRQRIAEGQQQTRQRVAALAVLLAFASVALLSVAAISIWRFLAEPLARLRDGAQSIAAGDLEHRLDIASSGEIGEVARAFDDMAQALAASNRALHNEIAERRAAEAEVRKGKQDVERIVERRTAQLVESNIRLEEATAAKDRFMARMSHELRTPLNSIIGFSKVLGSGVPGPLTAEQTLQLQMISNSGNRLLSLVNDLLDISVISAGRVDLVYEEVDLKQLGHDVVSVFEPMAASKGLDVRFECREPIRVVTDRQRLEQVLTNLLGNAVKFTDAGHVGLTIDLSPAGEARLSVTDTGIGISPELFDDVFSEFTQLAPPDGHVAEGTGLGLAIARSMVELLGGAIAVDSAPGEGSTFTVTLSAHAPLLDMPPHET